MAVMHTLERALKLIRLLTEQPRKRVDELGKYLGIEGRNVRNYLETFEEIGYIVAHDSQHRYYLELPDVVDTSKWGFKTSKDPRVLLAIADELIHIQRAKIVRRLGQAIEEKKRVMLKPYQSVSENTVQDRIVEPHQLKHDDKYLLAYEPALSSVRPFKVDRIGAVVLLDVNFPPLYSPMGLDVFGWSGESMMNVRLCLSELAYRLLIEEYPHAYPYIRKDPNGYLFDHHVYDLRGIGRFVMGLPGDVKILEPEALQMYVREQARRVLGEG